MNYQIQDGKIRVNELDFVSGTPIYQNNVNIAICTEGQVTAVCNGREKIMVKGDVMIAFPYDIHSFTSFSGKIVSISFPRKISQMTEILIGIEKYESFIYAPEAVNWAYDIYKEYCAHKPYLVIFGYLHIILGIISPMLKLQENHSDFDTFARAVDFMSENYITPINQQTVAKHVGCTTSHLSRLFSARVDGGFKYYLNFMRIEKAKRILERTNYKMYDIMNQSGFSDQYTFNRTFKKLTGTTPSKYRKAYFIENKTPRFT